MEKRLIDKIEPHFYYNALEYINSMAVINNISEISEVAISLGKMMRYWTDRDDQWIKINNEMNYIEHYLTISKLRYMNAFTFKVENNVNDHELCPIYILEPIVNEIILNIVQSKNKREINIKSDIVENKILFNISIIVEQNEYDLIKRITGGTIKEAEKRLINLTGNNIEVIYEKNIFNIKYMVSER